MMNTAPETVPFRDAAALAKIFRALLPRDAVLIDREDLAPYECDGLSAYRQLPMMVLLPDTVDQVCEILRVCSERVVPVIARGAGTGLSGGALPAANGILLSLARFNHILDL